MQAESIGRKNILSCSIHGDHFGPWKTLVFSDSRGMPACRGRTGPPPWAARPLPRHLLPRPLRGPHLEAARHEEFDGGWQGRAGRDCQITGWDA